MSLSFVQYTANGATYNFTVPFAYISKSDVAVTVDDVTAAFTWTSDSIVHVTALPADGAVVEVRRRTERSSAIVDYSDASTLTESNLDLSNLQFLYLVQEAADDAENSIQLASDATWDATNRRIKNVGAPEDDDDAATKEYADEQRELSAADVVLTHADVVLTHADAVLTAADVVTTTAKVALTVADVALTHADVVLTHADVVLTHADVVLTHADVVSSAASAAYSSTQVGLAAAQTTLATAQAVLAAASKTAADADVVLTHADVVLTHADVVLTHADVVTTAGHVSTAAGHVTSAAASAVLAAASLDSFDDRYLGPKSADPTLDNDGNALGNGALYWHSVNNIMRAYSTGDSAWHTVAAASALSTGDIGVTVQAYNANTIAVAPGTAGNVLTSNGSAWASTAPAAVDPTNAYVAIGVLASMNFYGP